MSKTDLTVTEAAWRVMLVTYGILGGLVVLCVVALLLGAGR